MLEEKAAQSRSSTRSSSPDDSKASVVEEKRRDMTGSSAASKSRLMNGTSSGALDVIYFKMNKLESRTLPGFYELFYFKKQLPSYIIL